MPANAPPLPRAVLVGAVAAVILAFGAFGVSGYQALRRSSEPRPARVSILAAVAELQARELAAQRAAPATPAPPVVSPTANIARPPSPMAEADGGACGLLHKRADHVGEAVAFRGEYLSDHEGPAEVRPLGCDAAIAVSDIEPAVEAAIERADPPPWTGPHRRLIGTFTARLVQSGAEFSYDEGVRLSISGLTDLRVTDQPPRHADFLARRPVSAFQSADSGN